MKTNRINLTENTEMNADNTIESKEVITMRTVKTNNNRRITKVFASALAVIMMMSSMASLGASAAVNTDAVIHMNANTAMSDSDAELEFLHSTAVKLGMTALEEYVPGGKLIAPVVGEILEACGLMPKETSLDDINNNIIEMRAEIKAQLKDISNKMDKNTKDILDAIKNETYLKGFGTEIFKLHTSAEGMALQIDSFNRNTSLTREERAVEIASLIGNNTVWNTDGQFVYRMKTLAKTLSGETLENYDGRDMYQVLYDNELRNVYFSGEAYDRVSPYVDSVMLEYFYAYSVMAQCFSAADEVAQFTPEQINALSDTAKSKYYRVHSVKSVVDAVFEEVSTKIYDGERADSVVSAYAVFNYKKAHQRNIFVDKGNCNIVISPEVKENTFNYGVIKSSDVNADSLNKAKSMINEALSENAIKGSKVNELYKYAYNTYDKMSFDDFLEYVGIDVSNFRGSTTKMFASCDTAVADEFFENGDKVYTIGFDTFCHRLSAYRSRNYEYMLLSRTITPEAYRSLAAGADVCGKNTHHLIRTEHKGTIGYQDYTYYTYSLKEYNEVMLTFREGTLASVPATAAKILEKKN